MEQKITESCSQLQGLLESFCARQGSALQLLAGQIAEQFAAGGQLLLAGGAAFQPVVQLLAGHFTYRLGFDRPTLPAIALGSDACLAALMANHGVPEQHLVRHYRALNSENHLLLLINDGSASEPLQALRDEALDNDRPVALLTSDSATDPLCRDRVSPCIETGTPQVARQLELALFAGQLLCELVEGELFGV